MNSDTEIAARIFARAKALLPSSGKIFVMALSELLLDAGDQEHIKANFSRLVANVQVRAYEVYLEAEAKAVGTALREIIEPLLPGSSSADLFDFLTDHFQVLDRVFLSLTQSRRTRAGKTFELVVTTLFQALGYPYTHQPELLDSRPDYVLPSIGHYNAYAADCLVFTCKRTLRERWRQVVTEGTTSLFFLATIDERLSGPELARMQQSRVIVVVPADLKQDKYAGIHNVISFEEFFEHRLDPAVKRWRASGAIPN